VATETLLRLGGQGLRSGRRLLRFATEPPTLSTLSVSTWAGLVGIAVGGSAVYGASLSLHFPRWACPSSRSAGKASVFSAHTIKNGGVIAWLHAYDMPSFSFSDESIIPHRERKSEQSSAIFSTNRYIMVHRPAMWHASA
jgi:hypothetical protein